MSRVGTSIVCLIFGAVAAVPLVAGCNRSSGPAPGAVVAKPTPEESFNFIMETFRRRIEGPPSGFVADNAGGGRSRLSASNKVESEVFPPAKEGDPYRAEVTVYSAARFSLKRAVDESGEPAKKDESRSNQSGIPSLDNPVTGGNGVGILDPELVSSRGNEPQARQTGPTAGESVVTRREEEEKRVFKLEYVDGRWRLLTQPDPKTEKAIQSAFDEAIAAQF